MVGDPYVRDTQRRVRRHERNVWIAMLIVVAALLIAASVTTCGNESSAPGATCLEGQACE